METFLQNRELFISECQRLRNLRSWNYYLMRTGIITGQKISLSLVIFVLRKLPVPWWVPHLQDFSLHYFPKASSLNTINIRIWEIKLLIHQLLENILTVPVFLSLDSQHLYPHLYKTLILTFRAKKNKVQGWQISQYRVEEMTSLLSGKK